jgi:Protein of unknown function (DUF4232)
MGLNRISARLRGGNCRQRKVGIAMTGLGHIGWRVAVVIVAFAGTAALAVALTRAPERSQAALPATGCPTSGLRASLGLGQPGTRATGSTYYTLEFTNVSHQVCSLFGYPKVSAYVTSQPTASQPGGPSPAGPVGSAAIHDPSVRPRPVRLEPGETAQALLRITGTGSSRPATCVRVTTEELRVTLPHQGRPSVVPVHISVCSPKGHLSLTVQALQAQVRRLQYSMP